MYPDIREGVGLKKRSHLFIVPGTKSGQEDEKKRFRNKRVFVDAKISLVPSCSALSHSLYLTISPPAVYLKTHYTRFVLKTVQFIGGLGLLIRVPRRLYSIILKESRGAGRRTKVICDWRKGDPLVITGA